MSQVKFKLEEDKKRKLRGNLALEGKTMQEFFENVVDLYLKQKTEKTQKQVSTN